MLIFTFEASLSEILLLLEEIDVIFIFAVNFDICAPVEHIVATDVIYGFSPRRLSIT